MNVDLLHTHDRQTTHTFTCMYVYHNSISCTHRHNQTARTATAYNVHVYVYVLCTYKQLVTRWYSVYLHHIWILEGLAGAAGGGLLQGGLGGRGDHWRLVDDRWQA